MRIGARARSAARHRVIFLLPMPASVRFNSTPSTARKGNSAARSIARPMPAPRSTKVNSSKAAVGFSLRQRTIMFRNTEGATPKYAVLCRSDRCPLFRCRPATSPLVRTPNSKSKGCRMKPSFTASPGSNRGFFSAFLPFTSALVFQFLFHVVIPFSVGRRIAMPISIFHVGLALDHPSIPVDDRPQLTKRLADLRQSMIAESFNYEFIHCSPEKGLDDFKHQLRTHPCDGVLIGGGVVGNPTMTYFLEQIVNTAHELLPSRKDHVRYACQSCARNHRPLVRIFACLIFTCSLANHQDLKRVRNHRRPRTSHERRHR